MKHTHTHIFHCDGVAMVLGVIRLNMLRNIGEKNSQNEHASCYLAAVRKLALVASWADGCFSWTISKSQSQKYYFKPGKIAADSSCCLECSNAYLDSRSFSITLLGLKLEPIARTTQSGGMRLSAIPCKLHSQRQTTIQYLEHGPE